MEPGEKIQIQKKKKKKTWAKYVKPWVEWQLDKDPNQENWWASLWLLNGDATQAFNDFPTLLKAHQIKCQWSHHHYDATGANVHTRLCVHYHNYEKATDLWKKNFSGMPLGLLDPWHHYCVRHHQEQINEKKKSNLKVFALWQEKFGLVLNLATQTQFPSEIGALIMSYVYEKWYEIAFPKLWQMAKPYQQTGVDYFIKRMGCGILADDMGLGKTLQAIMITMVYNLSRPCLIICPKSLFNNWEQNVARFVYGGVSSDATILSIRSTKEFEERFNNPGGLEIQEETTIPEYIILSFGLITRIVQKASLKSKKVLEKIQFLIIDESHACKNVTSQRTAALLQVASWAKHRLCLSGTPACKPKEMYPQWVMACPTLPPRQSLTAKIEIQDNLLKHAVSEKMSQEQFVKLLYEHVCFSYVLRWCNPQLKIIRKAGSNRNIPQLVIDGSARLHELFCILRMSCMLHRPKSILEKELPDLMRYKILFRPPILSQRVFEQSTQEIKKWTHDKERCRPIYMREFNENIPAAKKEFAKTYLMFLINDKRYKDQKFIFYAHHKTFMQDLAALLEEEKIEHVVIQGDTSGEARTAAEQDFQNQEKNIRVALISVMAGGTGLNLQAASVVVFCELIWSPDVMLQAEARVNRLGQTKKVECHYLVADPSLDDLILRIYRCKNINSGMILTGNARHVPFHVSVDLRQFPPLCKENKTETLEFLSDALQNGDPVVEDEQEEEDDPDEFVQDLARIRI